MPTMRTMPTVPMGGDAARFSGELADLAGDLVALRPSSGPRANATLQ
ncbi:MAG: hypothetical protein IPL40_06020 [Proteobacteria bacterium]|nr:hypothetical protein [Pseudomonadota bacterium]